MNQKKEEQSGVERRYIDPKKEIKDIERSTLSLKTNKNRMRDALPNN